MRGEVAKFDIKDSDGKVLVEKEHRILGKHIKAMKVAKLKELEVNDEFLFDRVIAKSIIDPDTGEELVAARERHNFFFDVTLRVERIRIRDPTLLFLDLELITKSEIFETSSKGLCFLSQTSFR